MPKVLRTLADASFERGQEIVGRRSRFGQHDELRDLVEHALLADRSRPTGARSSRCTVSFWISAERLDHTGVEVICTTGEGVAVFDIERDKASRNVVGVGVHCLHAVVDRLGPSRADGKADQ